jgi:hypothetical protein
VKKSVDVRVQREYNFGNPIEEGSHHDDDTDDKAEAIFQADDHVRLALAIVPSRYRVGVTAQSVAPVASAVLNLGW